jgi:HlyD family secretion protein
VDRPLTADTLRRDRLRAALKIAVPLLLVAAILAWLPGWMRPTIAKTRLRTAVVTVGPLDASITASGTVVPEIERVISAPLDARVLRILGRPGATVSRGEPVVELDVSESQLALEQAIKDLKVKDNQQLQTRLGYEKSLVDLDGRLKVKQLQLETAKARLEGDRRLFAEQLVSRDALRTSELAVRQAEIELLQLTEERANAARTTAVQLEGLSLERGTLDRSVGEARRLLDLATTKADRDGVLTWIVNQEGALVRKGDVLARIADLTSFRVDATVSDVHASRLRPGMPVVVKVNDVDLEGRVADVFPAVENGTVRFTVALDQRSHPGLRPSLRADVLVVTDRKPRVLRVERGPFADGSGARHVFVVRGNRGVRTPVTLGLASFDRIEVVAGLAVGDEVIVSDMRDYAHLSEIALK